MLPIKYEEERNEKAILSTPKKMRGIRASQLTLASDSKLLFT